MGWELDEFAADSSGAANSQVDGSRKPDSRAGEPYRKWIQQSTGLRAVVVRLRESAGGDPEPGGCRRSSVAPVESATAVASTSAGWKLLTLGIVLRSDGREP